jgi:hypothetical protein
MNKKPTKAQEPDTEDAAWWRENSAQLGKHLRAAVKAGEKITTDELRRRIEEASKKKPATVVALRIPQADLTLARKQAEQKGLPYQTYIKSLLHQALLECENRDQRPRKIKRP